MQNSSLLVAQISDIHLFADVHEQLLGLPTIESFQAVIRQLESMKRRPDLLLLTGDLSQDSKPGSYTTLHRLLRPLNIPTYWIAGNHDCLTTMQLALDQPPFYAQKSFQAGNWQFLLLNSSVPGQVHGYLSRESLDWLDLELSQSRDRSALVALHHPPFVIDSAWLDGSNLQNADELFEVLDRHSHVKLVLFGHIHQEYSCQRHQIQYLGIPSTCIQFEPNSHQFALDDEESPGFRLLNLYPSGLWQTSVERTVYTCQLDLVTAGY